VDEVMNGLDIVALSSLNEGTPLSIIEAQYFKKPVVSTDVGGVKDTVLDGRSGFLVASNDAIAFTEKLRLLIDDKNLRQAMGEEGHRFVSTRFSKQSEIQTMSDFYQLLLKQKSRSS
jgi:glycosyltransferase involved in cell wall biosynthesis